MPDSLELRKRKAKAKLALARQRGGAPTPTPQHTFGSEQVTEREAPDALLNAKVAGVEAGQEATGQFQKGMHQMFGANQPFDIGRSVAGLGNVGMSILKTPAPLIAGARELMRPGVLNAPIEWAEQGLGTIGDFTGGIFREGSQQTAEFLGASPETAKAISEPAGEFGAMAGQGVALGIAGKGLASTRSVVPAVERGFETMGMRSLKAGDDLATRQLATRQALNDPNYQISPKGSAFAESRHQMLQGEKMMNQVIPATERGDLYSVQPIRTKFKGLIDEFEASGGRNNADVLAVKKVAQKFEDIVAKEGFEGEYLTPQRLEVFKEDLNRLLRKDFKAMKRGQPSELAPIKKQALMEEVSGAKGILEEKLPGIKDLNKAQSTEIIIQDAIDDALFRMSGGMKTPTGLTSALGGNPAGVAALGISEKIFKPNVRFGIAGKGYRAARKLQGKPTGSSPVPSYQKQDLYSPVPTHRQLMPPAIELGPGGISTIKITTGPVSAVPDISLNKPKQLERGPIRLGGPESSGELMPHVGKRVEDLQWNPKTRTYESKPAPKRKR